MTGTKITEAQTVHERIEALKTEGSTNADAIRQVANERGKSENAVRANQHQYRQKLRGRGPSARGGAASRSTISVEDAVAQARQLLTHALAAIDAEVDAAKTELDAARRKHEALVAAAEDRKAELGKKIKALD